MANLIDLLKVDGFEFRHVAASRGGEFAGPCPWCGGRDRFRVWPFSGEKGGYFFCRREDKKGDAITYLREFRKMPFKEACALLGVNCGTPAARHMRQPINVQQGANEDVKTVTVKLPGDIWRQRALSFVERAEKQLAANREAMGFLHGRGLTDETIKAARLGWNMADEYRPRAAWGIEYAQAEGRPAKVWVPAGLIIPCFAEKKVARLRVRRAAGEPRYVVVSGSSRAPFICGTGRHAAVVVESELDALLLAQEAGDLVTVAALGSATGKPCSVLHDLVQTAPLVLIALDNDEAGAAAALWWLKHYRHAERWPVPQGKDQTEAFLHGVNLRAWIKAGAPVCALLDAAKLKKPKVQRDATKTSEPLLFSCLSCSFESEGLCTRFLRKPKCLEAVSYCWIEKLGKVSGFHDL